MSCPSAPIGGPNPIDRHVGARIRLRRKQVGLSEERLAEALGLTFQQVQKYERAANRVSASKLFEIARVLDVAPSFFYEGLEATAGPMSGPPFDAGQYAFIMSADGQELAHSFPRVRARARRKIIELVRALVSAEADAASE